MRIPAAVRREYGAASGIIDFRNKSSRTDNSRTMQFCKLYRRSYLVNTRREIQNAIGIHLFSSMWVSRRAKAIVGGSLNGLGIVRAKVSDRAELRVFNTDHTRIGWGLLGNGGRAG